MFFESRWIFQINFNCAIHEGNSAKVCNLEEKIQLEKFNNSKKRKKTTKKSEFTKDFLNENEFSEK